MLVGENQLPGFIQFMKEVFGATVQERNKGENLVITLASGLIIGVKNGVFYNLSGERELLKNIENLWLTALAATQSASTCTTNGDEQ